MSLKNNPPYSEGRAWWLMHRLFSAIEKCEESALKNFGITVHEYQVLKAIVSLKENITPTTISTLLDKTPYSVTILIDRMEKRGLVERKRDLDDRRSLRIVITPEGKKKYMSVVRPATEVRNKLLSVLTTEELSELIRIMEKISEQSFEYRNFKDKFANTPI